MATETDSTQGRSHATLVRAAVAAAATGAAAYGVLKLRSSGDEPDEQDSADEEAVGHEAEESDAGGKREELTHALATKLAGAKNATSRLKPNAGGSRSVLDSAWDAASEQLLPIARDAATALGTTVAKNVPEMVRDELMPRFIEGFRRAS